MDAPRWCLTRWLMNFSTDSLETSAISIWTVFTTCINAPCQSFPSIATSILQETFTEVLGLFIHGGGCHQEFESLCCFKTRHEHWWARRGRYCKFFGRDLVLDFPNYTRWQSGSCGIHLDQLTLNRVSVSTRSHWPTSVRDLQNPTQRALWLFNGDTVGRWED